MSQYDYDVIVIGSGPAGEGAAMKAAKQERNVAVVERYRKVGGGCTHWGTIPSKALRHAIQVAGEIHSHPLYRKLGGTQVPTMTVSELIAAAQQVISRQVDMREGFYERNFVPVAEGEASFADEHTLVLKAPDGGIGSLTSDKFIIATGSRPYHPADVDFSHPRIYDADSILALAKKPRTMTVYGAGVIGCEYASMLRAMGVKINLINTRAKLLEFLDDEIIDALAYHMRDQGILIRHNEEYKKIEPLDDGVMLHLKSGKQIKTDALLWANGRSPNTDSLGLDQLDIELDKRGRIVVNENFQTKLPHIYAVGDVIGPPGLASASYDQGRFAATHLCDGEVDYRLVRDIPAGIYTTPEISCVGKTERELTQEKVPYEVGHAFFKSLARAQITGQTVGMLKLLFHRDTLAILGIHCFGANASEIVHIGQAIMYQQPPNNTIDYFAKTTFNYPTMAEAYRVAALNGMNRVAM